MEDGPAKYLPRGGQYPEGNISPPAAIQFEEMEGEDFGQHKGAKGRQQVGAVYRGTVKSNRKDEREDARDGKSMAG